MRHPKALPIFFPKYNEHLLPKVLLEDVFKHLVRIAKGNWSGKFLKTLPLKGRWKALLFDGKKHGEVIGKYENGQIRYKQTYILGKKQGKCITYYDTGEILRETEYNNGVILYSEYYHKNGNFEIRKRFKNGILHGDYIRYYENGETHLIVPYVNGKIRGMKKSFYDNGMIHSKIPYVNGLKHGESIEFSRSPGKPPKKTKYVRGVEKE